MGDIRTASLRHALNDMRAAPAAGRAVPTTVKLDDGSTLTIRPTTRADMAPDAHVVASDFAPDGTLLGHFIVTRADANGRRKGGEYWIK